MTDYLPEQTLFAEISALVEQAKATVAAQANRTATRLYRQIRGMINTSILREKRAEYGKRIVSALATQLTWSHFIELLPLRTIAETIRKPNSSLTIQNFFGIKGLTEQ